MDKLANLRLERWFLDKQSEAFVTASVNTAYKYEIAKETEKAIQIKIIRESAMPVSDWLVWIPKSAIVKEKEPEIIEDKGIHTENFDIVHKTFGKGKIIKEENGMLIVDFEGNEKAIMNNPAFVTLI